MFGTIDLASVKKKKLFHSLIKETFIHVYNKSTDVNVFHLCQSLQKSLLFCIVNTFIGKMKKYTMIFIILKIFMLDWASYLKKLQKIIFYDIRQLQKKLSF